MYIHNVRLSLCLLYLKVLIVLCAFVCHMIVMFRLKKQMLWNIKLYAEKFKICTLYTEMHSVLLVCVVFT
jgi:hypothetical protein